MIRSRAWALLVLVVVVSASHVERGAAASAIEPADGDTLGSRPVFGFDFVYGTATVELSRSPDTMANGSDPGGFVDPDGSRFELLYEHQPLDGRFTWPEPLDQGRWYWHAKVRDDGSPETLYSGTETPWGEVRRFDVVDEEIQLTGSTLRAERLRTLRGCARVRLRGTVTFEDNDPQPTVQLSVSLRAGGSRVGSRTLELDRYVATTGRARYDVTFCTRARRSKARITVTDRGEHASSAERVVSVR